MGRVGTVVILNGAPRSGKSTIARAVQESFEETWINLGVDSSMGTTPPRLWPGIGLRPGGERPDLEPWVQLLYAALYESVAAHARLGLNVIVDVGHHDSYSRPLGILDDCLSRLSGLPVLLVGVRCPLDVIWERRKQTWGQDRNEVGEDVIAAADRWQSAVHEHMHYDLEVDTSVQSPAECVVAIRAALDQLQDLPMHR